MVESLIAFAVIFGFARKLTYISSALFSLSIYATAEGFGGPYIAGSTDIGTSVIYVLVFIGLLALDYETGPSRFSVDSLIEQRVSWWHRIAEIGPRSKPEKPATAPEVPTTVPIPPVMHAPVGTSNRTLAAPLENQDSRQWPVLENPLREGKRTEPTPDNQVVKLLLFTRPPPVGVRQEEHVIEHALSVWSLRTGGGEPVCEIGNTRDRAHTIFRVARSTVTESPWNGALSSRDLPAVGLNTMLSVGELPVMSTVTVR